jgi:hypothetical protein
MKTVKIDERAFARGVDDALTLRPLRQLIEKHVTQHRDVAPNKGKVSIVRPTKQPARQR